MFGHPVPQATADAITRRLPLFDGFPYLTTRLVPAAYHLTLLPGHWDRERLIAALVQQVEANQFQTALGPRSGGSPLSVPGHPHRGQHGRPAMYAQKLQAGGVDDPLGRAAAQVLEKASA